jgi:hypothetical protein
VIQSPNQASQLRRASAAPNGRALRIAFINRCISGAISKIGRRDASSGALGDANSLAIWPSAEVDLSLLKWALGTTTFVGISIRF